ncbi:hypothetical protein H6G33_07560 [Calothrix sp. FACHB-1219]|nr:hypothetical protein [Calothrix sp. FACHB-168]MBD2216884.1 hypothetical protein [Calothrix sp. FACHB-1219]
MHHFSLVAPVGWVDVRKLNTSIYVEFLKFMLGFAKPQPNLHLMHFPMPNAQCPMPHAQCPIY